MAASCSRITAIRRLLPFLAAVFGGQGEAVEASFVCSAAGFSEYVFPFFAWGAAGVRVGSGVLAAVVEEAFVVVLGLEGSDFTVNEGVEVEEVLGEFLGDVEVHFSCVIGVKCSLVSRYSNVFVSKVLMINGYSFLNSVEYVGDDSPLPSVPHYPATFRNISHLRMLSGRCNSGARLNLANNLPEMGFANPVRLILVSK